MSRPHDVHRPSFPFGNPIRMFLPKGTSLSPKLKSLLNSFEESLANRFKKLKPKDESDIVSLSWMRHAVESLSETHTDVKALITDLQFPVSDWDNQWMDIYLDDSVKLLDICISFSSEISRLEQGQLLLQYVLHVLDSSSGSISAEELKKAHESLNDWILQINSRSPKLENSFLNLQGLATSLCFTKAKRSAKGKILMQAMYGVKMQTIFVCSIFSAAFASSTKPLMNLQVSEKFPWASCFNDLQTYMNGELKRVLSVRPAILRELEAVNYCVEKLRTMVDDAMHFEGETLQRENENDYKSVVVAHGRDERKVKTERLHVLVTELDSAVEKVSDGLEPLSKKIGEFFQIVLSGRDALLCNLRLSDVMERNDVDLGRRGPM